MSSIFTDRTIMAALATILPGYPAINTRLGQIGGNIVIQDEYAISTGRFPALHLEVGPQKHTIKSASVYNATMKIIVTYYDRWDTRPDTIDDVRTQIDTDMQQMMTNVEQNPSLVIGMQDNSTSIPTLELSDYKGENDAKIVPGIIVVKRFMTLTVNILSYDAF